MKQPPHVLILAAGQGKRMHSKLPKVLHSLLFRPMLHHILDVAQAIPHRSVSVIVGANGDAIKHACTSYRTIQFFQQKEPRGTGDAVLASRAGFLGQSGDLLILSADVPLLRAETLNAFLKFHSQLSSVATLMTALLSNPKGYGRILRNTENNVIGIREETDCTEAESKIQEVNSGTYCFEIPSLFETLDKMGDRNHQGEFYLTDAIELLNRGSRRVSAFILADPDEMIGINDREALGLVEQKMQARVNRKYMQSGVTLHSYTSTFIDPKCQIDSDVTLEGNITLINSILATGATIESGCRIVNSRIGPHTLVKQGSYIEGSEVGPNCVVGPYAHLRPGSRLDSHVKIGNFVEIKNSSVAPGSKASHLSYIGDAEIGKNVNIGCGFITCNFDGQKKHKTVIEDDVFVGSDSQTVAPVTIGRGSYVASGSTVTENSPPDSLILSRGKQVTKPGYAMKYKKV